jgi:anti-sigma factor (TIGR02949 family)
MDEQTMRCEDALRLLAAYLDQEIGEVRRADLERHLETCRSCYSRAEFEKRLKGQLAELRNRPVDSAFEQRIRTLIRHF